MHHILIILLAINISGVLSAICNNSLVSPCICKTDTQIECMDISKGSTACNKTYIENTKQLRAMFEKISANTADDDKYFDEFSLSSNCSYLLELPSDSFLDITFESIVINRFLGLTKISSTAFRLSNPYLHRFVLNDAPLNNRADNDYNLFDALNSARYLQSVVISNTYISAVPDKAFQSKSRPLTSLTSIEISGNKYLESLGSDAFNDLTNLTVINLRGNQLKKIASNSFNITNIGGNNITIDLSNNAITAIDAHSFSGNIPMIIDLSKNKLNSSSFSADAFTNIGKPSTIKLSDNPLIKAFRQNLFEPALNAGHEFRMDRNILTCDCSVYWLLKSREKYMKQIVRAFCDDGFELFEDDRQQYMNCE